MKKQWIVVILTAAVLAYDLYWHTLVTIVGGKEYFFNWLIIVDNVILLLLIAGLVQYVVTKWRRSLLLRITLFYNTFLPLVSLLLLLVYFWFARHDAANNDYIAKEYLRSYFRSLPLLIGSFYALNVLNRSRKTAADSEFVPVSRWMRLLIHATDIGFVIWTFNSEKAMIYLFWNQYVIYSNLEFLLILKWPVIALIFLYFLFMEGITGISLGKLLTNTIIVDETGQRAGFWPRISRSFARLIPFDSWSFLFAKKGWHDSLSDTYVVKN